MERWSGKVAVVTGASSGLGAAIAVDLVGAGMIVVGLARRKEVVEELRSQIPSEAKGKLHAFACDVSNDESVAEAFKLIESELGAIHVLVNNAGTICFGAVTDEGNEEMLKSTLDTNLWGVVLCTKKAVEIMKRNNVTGAHIININSVAGHSVVSISPVKKQAMNVYPSSKFGVTALTEVLRQEFNHDKLQYKVTVGYKNLKIKTQKY